METPLYNPPTLEDLKQIKKSEIEMTDKLWKEVLGLIPRLAD